MILPCITCKHRTVRKEGHRAFVGCNDAKLKKGFEHDDYFYHHSCTNYEEGDEE